MQTKDAIASRRSTREFDHLAKISKENILALIDAARLAPTARNIQPWEFIAVTDRSLLKHIGDLADNGSFIRDASLCVAIFCKDTKYYLEDGCAATENLLLAASDLGLASCWVAGDKKPYCSSIKELLKVPDEFRLVSLIALGKAKAKREDVVSKRSLNEVIHWDKY